MHVAFNTEELTPLDVQILSALVAGIAGSPAPTPEPAKAAPAKKAAPAAAKPAATPAPEPVAEATPEPQEDLLGGDTEPEPEGPTMADAVAAATKLVSSGGAPKVKEALAAVGAKRVSEIPSDQIAAFLAALA